MKGLNLVIIYIFNISLVLRDVFILIMRENRISIDRNIKSASLAIRLLMKIYYIKKVEIRLISVLIKISKINVIAYWAIKILLQSGLCLIIEMSFKFDILDDKGIKILIIWFLAIRDKHVFGCLIILKHFQFLRIKYISTFWVFHLQYDLADILWRFESRLRLWRLIEK